MNAFARLRPWLPTLTLGFVVVFTVAYFVFSHEGLYALDDYFYARYAHQLLHGTFHLGPDPQGLLHDPLHERWLIFGPVALCYAAFGLNIWSTTLWPLVATLLCSVLIWARYRRRQPVVACGAMLLLGLHYFALNLTNYLYPDNINMLACFAAALALLVGRQPGRHAVRWGAGFALLNFAALLCKETVVYYAPFYLGVLGLDAVRRQHGRFWLAAFATGAAVLAAYLGFYQLQTNDALYRVHLIENTNEFLKEGNYLLGNRAALWARLTLGPVQFLVGTGLGLAVLLAVGAAFRPTATQHHGSSAPPDDDRRFWLGLAFSTLAFYWFGSTSLTQYNPITLLPRMATPLLPPLCLAAGYGLADVLRTGRRAWLYALLLLACAASDRGSAAILYAGWALVMGALWLAPRLRRLQPNGPAYVALGLLGVALVLALRPAHFMRKPSVSGHFPQHRLIRQHLGGQQPGVVFVDDYLIGNYDFYYAYEVPSGLQYRRYWARDSVQLRPPQQAWLLLNRATLSNPELTRKLLRYSPDSVLRWYPNRQLVAQDGPVELYWVKEE
ncbi:glycosyltransferase family 39 protein [Hymenobacter latericus]|uniref:glycosyltransferase family 39 protein n=1 Tax=Hymenobacter sp. YIM 151858-1 TaxID=2987688 RepID=UPI0022278FCC|nr:glycosyltransferase family 39 protein [Hymenobacter sp. YIM 151858-1]UYZ60473.1 glycosyltransferase family 39 protein [Hymenobacter sp. YIM 151858-1]